MVTDMVRISCTYTRSRELQRRGSSIVLLVWQLTQRAVGNTSENTSIASTHITKGIHLSLSHMYLYHGVNIHSYRFVLQNACTLS